jgi:hypothetical protein
LERTNSAPYRFPEEIGENLTVIVHEALGANWAVQVVVSLKSPRVEMLEMLSGAAPKLVMV